MWVDFFLRLVPSPHDSISTSTSDGGGDGTSAGGCWSFLFTFLMSAHFSIKYDKLTQNFAWCTFLTLNFSISNFFFLIQTSVYSFVFCFFFWIFFLFLAYFFSPISKWHRQLCIFLITNSYSFSFYFRINIHHTQHALE